MSARHAISRRAATALAAASLFPAAAFSVLVVKLWPFTADDAFITLRYARHLAAGWGPVWNAGPVHDEGYTSALWTLLLAVPHLLAIDGELAAKALGTLAQLGAISACFALASAGVRAAAPAAGPWWAWCAAALYALHPDAAVHAVSGMETAAFTLAITALAVASAAALAPAAALRPGVLAGLALLSGLLRPEGNLVAGVVLAGTYAMLSASGRSRLLRAVLVGYVLPGAAYFLWRRWYHGEWLPLPFHVKAVHAAFLAGLPRVTGFLAETSLLIGLPLAIGLTALPRPLLPAVLGAAALVAFGLFPEHIMGFQARYLMPAAPVCFALAGLGLQRAHAWLAARPAAARVATPAVAALACVCAAALLSRAPSTLTNRLLYAEGLDRAHRVLARDLAAAPPGRLAISDAGVVPYVTDWPTRDLVGLNDRYTAVTGDHSPASVFRFAPDVLVLASQESGRFRPFDWNATEAPLAIAARERGFRLVRRYRFHDGYWLWLLADPSSRTGAALLARSDPH